MSLESPSEVRALDFAEVGQRLHAFAVGAHDFGAANWGRVKSNYR